MTEQDSQDKHPEKSKNEEASSPSKALVLFLIFPLLGILIALVMVAVENRQARESEKRDVDTVVVPIGSVVNFPAPDFALQDLDGNTVSLDDYAGRPVFINFWATWCIPCIQELPAFEAFIDEQDEVAVLAINFGESPEEVRTFFEGIGIENIPTVLDSGLNVKNSFGVQNLPTTFLIDAEGVVRYMKLGEMTIDEMEEFAEALNEDEAETN